MSDNNGTTEGFIEGLEDTFGSDVKLEADGAWMDIPGKPGMRIKLRSQNSAIVRNGAQKIQKRHRALYAANKLPSAEQQDEDEIELLSRYMVTAWEGFNLPFNEANVAKVMRRYPSFRDTCRRWSGELENYQKEVTDAMAGNSETTSTPS